MLNYDGYVYSDINNKLISLYAQKMEQYKGYWTEDEKSILDLMAKHIQENISSIDRRLLDAGCGDGRLLHFFEIYFDAILAIDPDMQIVKSTEDTARSKGLYNRTSFKVSSIEDLDANEKFDFILCSHVLQHVHTKCIPVIFDKFRRILKRQGVLFITTCYSNICQDYFTLNFLNGHHLMEGTINEEDFNRAIFISKTLPSHRFSINSLEELINSSGMRIIDFKLFHKLKGKSDNDLEISKTKGLSSSKEYRDIFIAAKGCNDW